jgi:hypothetical protein
VDVSPVRVAALVLVALAAGSTLACRGGEEESTDTTAAPPTTTDATTTMAAPTTTTALVSEEAVLAGNRAAWEAFFGAQDPPNPDLPALAATQTSLSLVAVRDFVASLQQQGIRYETEFESDARVAELSPDRAMVLDCLMASNESFRVDTGAPAGATDNIRHGFRIVLVPENGVWKWSERVIDELVCSAS